MAMLRSAYGYQVIRQPPAPDQLADAWTRLHPFGLAQAVTESELVLEGELARRPHEVGRPLHEGLYSASQAPIKVLYSIDERTRTVHVVAWRLLIDVP